MTVHEWVPRAACPPMNAFTGGQAARGTHAPSRANEIMRTNDPLIDGRFLVPVFSFFLRLASLGKKKS